MARVAIFAVRTSEPDKLYDELVKIWTYVEMEELDWDDPSYQYNWAYDVIISDTDSINAAIKTAIFLERSKLPYEFVEIG